MEMLTVHEGDRRCGGAGSTVYLNLDAGKVERNQQMERRQGVTVDCFQSSRVERRREGKKFVLNKGGRETSLRSKEINSKRCVAF